MNTTTRRNTGTSLLSDPLRAAGAAVALAACLLLGPCGDAAAQGSRSSGGMVLNATSDYRDMAVAHAREGRSGRHAPPRGGRFIYGHWTPYQPPSPESYGPNAATHVISAGESLWGISERHYGDGLLWPYLWESNSWILDPHWIYPGDVLLVPPLMTLPDGSLMVSGGHGFGTLADGYIPAGFHKDFYCGLFVASPNRKFFGEIAGFEADPAPIMTMLNDIVYVSVGSKDGVLPGDEFAIVYPRQHFDSSAQARGTWTSQLQHPMTGKKLGYPMHVAGRLKIILLGEEVSTAQIVYACDAVEIGYKIYPFMEVPQPLVSRAHAESPWDERRTSMPDMGRGFIAYVADEVQSGHQGLLAIIDLGAAEGVVPGDVFTIYRDQPLDFGHEDVDYLGDFWDFREGVKRMRIRRDVTEQGTWGNQRPLYRTPPRLLGRLVVLYTERHTATAKITDGNQEILAGDMIVYDPVGTGYGLIDSGLRPGVPMGFQTGDPAPMETFAPLGQ